MADRVWEGGLQRPTLTLSQTRRVDGAVLICIERPTCLLPKLHNLQITSTPFEPPPPTHTHTRHAQKRPRPSFFYKIPQRALFSIKNNLIRQQSVTRSENFSVRPRKTTRTRVRVLERSCLFMRYLWVRCFVSTTAIHPHLYTRSLSEVPTAIETNCENKSGGNERVTTAKPRYFPYFDARALMSPTCCWASCVEATAVPCDNPLVSQCTQSSNGSLK